MADAATLYKPLDPATKGKRIIGQIFWIPALLAMQDLFVIRLGKMG